MVDFTPQRVLWLRQSLDQTQDEFASGLGVARNTVARWEAGLSRPRGLSLKALGDLYRSMPGPRYRVERRTEERIETLFGTDDLSELERYDGFQSRFSRRFPGMGGRPKEEVVLVDRTTDRESPLRVNLEVFWQWRMAVMLGEEDQY